MYNSVNIFTRFGLTEGVIIVIFIIIYLFNSKDLGNEKGLTILLVPTLWD